MREDPMEHIELGEMPSQNSQVKHRPVIPNYNGKKEKESFADKLPLQLFMCAAVCLVALALKGMDTPFAKETIAGLKVAVSTDTDMDKAMGKLRFVTNIFGDAQEVFNSTSNKLIMPVKGNIAFVKADGAYDAEITSNMDDVVVSAAAGRIFYAGESDGSTLVRIVHADGYETRYVGLAPTVKVGDELEAGATIGTIKAGDVLKFSILHNSQPVDANALLG